MEVGPGCDPGLSTAVLLHGCDPGLSTAVLRVVTWFDLVLSISNLVERKVEYLLMEANLRFVELSGAKEAFCWLM